MTAEEAAQIVLLGVKYMPCQPCGSLGWIPGTMSSWVSCTLCHTRGGCIEPRCAEAFALLGVDLPLLIPLPMPLPMPNPVHRTQARILEVQQQYADALEVQQQYANALRSRQR